MVEKSPCSGDVRNAQRSKHGSVADPVAVGHESASVVEPSGATIGLPRRHQHGEVVLPDRELPRAYDPGEAPAGHVVHVRPPRRLRERMRREQLRPGEADASVGQQLDLGRGAHDEHEPRPHARRRRRIGDR